MKAARLAMPSIACARPRLVAPPARSARQQQHEHQRAQRNAELDQQLQRQVVRVVEERRGPIREIALSVQARLNSPKPTPVSGSLAIIASVFDQIAKRELEMSPSPPSEKRPSPPKTWPACHAPTCVKRATTRPRRDQQATPSDCTRARRDKRRSSKSPQRQARAMPNMPVREPVSTNANSKQSPSASVATTRRRRGAIRASATRAITAHSSSAAQMVGLPQVADRTPRQAGFRQQLAVGPCRVNTWIKPMQALTTPAISRPHMKADAKGSPAQRYG